MKPLVWVAQLQYVAMKKVMLVRAGAMSKLVLSIAFQLYRSLGSEFSRIMVAIWALAAAYQAIQPELVVNQVMVSVMVLDCGSIRRLAQFGSTMRSIVVPRIGFSSESGKDSKLGFGALGLRL